MRNCREDNQIRNSFDATIGMGKDESVHGALSGYVYQKEMANLSQEKQENVSRFIADFMSELYSRIMDLLEFVYHELDEDIIPDIIRFANYNFNRTLKHLGYKEVFEGEDVEFNEALKHEVEDKVGVSTNADTFSMVGKDYFMMANVPYSEEHKQELENKIHERHSLAPKLKKKSNLDLIKEVNVVQNR